MYVRFLGKHRQTYKVHPAIQTFSLPMMFCDTSKLNVYVFITMQAEEIHIHTRKINGFVEPPKFNFLDQAHVFRRNMSPKHKKWIVKRRVWMSGCQFCRCRPRKWPIPTYIHGPMPFQRGSIFSCMFTFAHAGRWKTPLHSPGLWNHHVFLTTSTTYIQRQLYSTCIHTYIHTYMSSPVALYNCYLGFTFIG